MPQKNTNLIYQCTFSILEQQVIMPFWLANHEINHVFHNPFDTIHYALVTYGIFF
jgi:fumarate reductase subunit D